MTSDTERRRAPRLQVELPVTLHIGEGSASAPEAASVRDLSLSGVCCVSPRPIGIMTKVGMTLVLSPAAGSTSISCRGAVVRSLKLPVGAAGTSSENTSDAVQYETAIFFTSMSDTDRVELQEFLQTLQELTSD